MSTVQPTDKTLVNRAGVDHSAPADMSTVQDTDLLLINRAGVDYKCTFLDWKNSQSKAPDVGAVTLSDVAGGSRFTSAAFPVSATMTEDGIPASTKKLKAYVEGTLKSAAQTSGIASVAGNVLTLADNTQLTNFAPGDAITEVTSTGTAGDATGTVGAVDAVAKTITLATTAGTWDVGSAVKGPLKTQMVTVTPNSDVITAVGGTAAAPVLTFATTKDLAKFAAGDVVKQNDSVGAVAGPGTLAIYGTPADVFDGNTSTSFGRIADNSPTLNGGFDIDLAGLNLIPATTTSVELYVNVRLGTEYQVNGVIVAPDYHGIAHPSAGWITIPVRAGERLSSISARGTSPGGSVGSSCDVAAIKVNGTIITGQGASTSGTVGSIDLAAKTMTLATSQGTWGPANAGKSAVGFTKTGPAANVKLYCKLNAAGAVSDLQSADPGFTAWTPTGTGPYTGTVTFPALLPTGAAPDTDLPAGTTITVEVEASNTSGSDSAKSPTITPA